MIASKQGLILVDCGFTVKETVRRMARLGLSPADLNAVIVTHEHGDHIKGVGPLARRYKMPVYMTAGTYHQSSVGNVPHLHLIEGYSAFTVEDMHIQPVAVPHDAREPSQFVISANSKRLGILTDLGSVSEHVYEQYHGCDALILEANHDPTMLANGPYPYSLKRRVGGQWGHLSNAQALQFLAEIYSDKLCQLVVAHISQKNNCFELVQREFQDWQQCIETVLFACQNEGFHWLDLNDQPVLSEQAS
ncbi:MBL fold metallo-hydrolase [Halioxenophilus aromaticivorans]|uniref:MBL fold metallo-hydrolase n=1 Tax=Halioxenophilus aromaticivorans TaxID=1306992 RepID=A0AAV3TYP4_9ALTE